MLDWGRLLARDASDPTWVSLPSWLARSAPTVSGPVVTNCYRVETTEASELDDLPRKLAEQAGPQGAPSVLGLRWRPTG